MVAAQTAQNEKTRQAEIVEVVHNGPTDERKKIQQDSWIDFCALGGLITHDSPEIEDGQPKAFKRITVGEFSVLVGVPRRTLYLWKKSIPDFGMRVRKRREELWPVARETAVFNRLLLIGMSGNGQPAVDALKVLAAHFAKLRLPVQEHEIEAGENLIDFIKLARSRKLNESND